MFFSRSGAKRQFFISLLLFAISAALTVVLFGLAESQFLTPPQPVAVETPAPPSVPPPDPITVKLTGLHRLYTAVEPTTVETLEAQAPEVSDDWTLELSSYSTLGTPPQYRIAAHASNFGDRFAQDVDQQPVKYDLLVVLHETTATVTSAIHQMLTNHPHDLDQVSYHALIQRDGTIVYTVDPRKRAYGAGDSVYDGPNGPETVKTNPNLASSVNNFAYHISLETPPDGMLNIEPTHSGYSFAQYESLAWLVARAGVPPQRIVTHAAVDRSGERQDPRSFEPELLLSRLEFLDQPVALSQEAMDFSQK